MRPALKDLHIEAATTYRRTLRFYTNSARTVPMNVTGFMFAAWIFKGSFRAEFNFNVSGAAQGSVVMELDPEKTSGVLPGDYSWDLLVKSPSGDINKYMKGAAKIYETGTKFPDEQ